MGKRPKAVLLVINLNLHGVYDRQSDHLGYQRHHPLHHPTKVGPRSHRSLQNSKETNDAHRHYYAYNLNYRWIRFHSDDVLEDEELTQAQAAE